MPFYSFSGIIGNPIKLILYIFLIYVGGTFSKKEIEKEIKIKSKFCLNTLFILFVLIIVEYSINCILFYFGFNIFTILVEIILSILILSTIIIILKKLIYLIKYNQYSELNKEIDDSLYRFKHSIIDLIADSQSSSIGNLIITKTQIIYANLAAAKILGYSVDEIKKYTIYDLINLVIHPNYREIANTRLKKLLDKRILKNPIYTYQIITKSGKTKWLDIHSKLITYDKNPALLISFLDSTERFVALKKLLNSREKFKGKFENMSWGVIILEAINDGNDFIIKKVNPFAEDILKINKNKLIKKRLSKFATRYGLKEFLDLNRKVWKSDNLQHVVFSINIKKYPKIWLENFLYKSKTGEIINFFNDITEIINKGIKLVISKEYLHDLLENAPIGVVEVDVINRKINYINQEMLNLTGYTINEFNSLDIIKKLIYPEDYEKIFNPKDNNRIPNISNGYKERILEFRIITKSGELKWVYGKQINFFRSNIKTRIRIWLYDITDLKKMQYKLRKSEERYKLITENANDLIAIFDNQGRHEFINEETYYRIMGYKKEEILNRSSLESLHPDDLEIFNKSLEVYKQTGEWYSQLRYRKKNGEYIWLDTKGRKFIDVDGKSKLIVISRDITKEKMALEKLKISEQKLRENEEKFRAIANFAGDGIISLDNNGKIVFWNKAAEKIFGYTAEEIIGKEFHKYFIFPEHYKKFKNGFNKFKLTGTGPIIGKTIEFYVRRKDGKKVPIELTVTGIKTKNEWGAMAIIRDITERKIAENAKERLIREIQKRNKELEEWNKLKDEFFTDVSHEFRTPLTAVIGYSDILLKNNMVEDPVVKDYIQTILRNALRLHDLIKEIVSHTRLEAKQIEFKEDKFKVSSIIEMLRDDFKVQLMKKNLKIIDEYISDTEIIFDKEQIIKLLRNLISNAIKFSEENSEIRIISEINDKYWICSVIDQGIGIKKEDLSKMFTRFGKLEYTKKRNSEGLGLGLAICKKIVDAYNGEIWAESDGLNKGATFTFKLPLKNNSIITYNKNN
ncbi:MAG: PAS domain S-box protein [Candidatus Helarchaeota archaeon]